MKKNGFTLVELLAVIVILGIIITLAIPKVMKTVTDKKQTLYEDNISELERLAASYVTDNPGMLRNDSFLISIEALCIKDYIDCPIIDPRDNSEITGNIAVNKINNKYEYSYLSNFVTAEITINTGEEVNSLGIHNQDEIIALEALEKENYEFAGWKVTQGNSIISGNTMIVGTQDTTVKAQWIKLPELIVNLDNGILLSNPQGKYSPKSFINLGIPIKENYEFTGWKVISGNSILSVSNLMMGTQDTIVEAQWIALEYPISYILNGGILNGEYPTTYNMIYGATLINPTRLGYIFTGWTGSNGETMSNSVTIASGSTGNKSYTANWIEAPNKNFDYTGEVQEFTVSINGIYKIELWGAQGGTGNASEGGKGGYTSGKINLQSGEKLYVYVGSKGNAGIVGSSATCPFNGGGNGGTRNNSPEGESGAGGGATDIRCFVSNNLCIDNTSNLVWSDDIGLKSRIMVAGGGGGGANFVGAALGGYAGGKTGSNGILNSDNASHTLGTGGTQKSGGSSATSGGTSGLFGKGGNGKGTSYGAGGGSGYYGGGTGGNTSGGVSSGAGGSSYISGYTGCVAVTSDGTPKPGCDNETTDNSCSIHYSGKIFINDEDMKMIAGNASMPTHDGTSTMIGNSGNGFVKITYIEN